MGHPPLPNCTPQRYQVLAPRSAILIACALVLSAGCGKDDATTQPTGSSDGERVVQIPTGGQLEFPAGGLPAGATVHVESSSTPVLPLGVEAIGEAFRAEVSMSLTRPVTIRLPVPPGADPDELVIFQVEDEGTPIMLGTELVEDMLVATSPGFGLTAINPLLRLKAGTVQAGGARVVTGRILDRINDPHAPPHLSPPELAHISGPLLLELLQSGLYVLLTTGLHQRVRATQITWTHQGPISFIQHPSIPSPTTGSTDRVAVSALELGMADLLVDYIDALSGTRAFASRAIFINASTSQGSGFLQLMQFERFVAGRPCSAKVFARHFAPVGWAWDYGDNQIDSRGISVVPGNVLTLPAHIYPRRDRFLILVSARDATGEALTARLTVDVMSSDLAIEIRGPDRFPPTSGGTDTRTFTADLVGGTPNYTVNWHLYPGQETVGELTSELSVSESFHFDEPGTYYLSATVVDEESHTATFTRLVTVTLDVPVSGTLGLSSRQVSVNDLVTASIRMRGGVLVVNGEKKGYLVEINWGDDSPVVREEVASFGPQVGANTELTHHYLAAGTRTVEASVTDGKGGKIIFDPIQVTIDDGGPPIEYNTCTVGFKVRARMRDEIDGATSYREETREFGSHVTRGNFTGSMYTGNYEGFGHEEQVTATVNAGRDTVTQVSLADSFRDISFDIDSETHVTVTSVPQLPGSVFTFEVRGEAVCDFIETLTYTWSSSANWTVTLVSHECDAESHAVISFSTEAR